MPESQKNGWLRLIVTSTVISAIVTFGGNYFLLKNKQNFEIKKDSIQRKLITLERLASNLDLLESRLFALKITSAASESKSPKALSQRDLQTYAFNAGLVVRALNSDVSILEGGEEARTTVEKLLSSLAVPLNQAQATPARLDALIQYLDGSFTSDKNDAAAKIKDAMDRLSHDGL